MLFESKSYDKISSYISAIGARLDGVRTTLRIRCLLPATICAALVICFFGCAKRIIFTKSLIDQYDLSPDELKSLQFYVSDKYVMTRLATAHGAVRTHVKLVTIKGRQYEVVELRAGTPGIVDSVGRDFQELFLSFEPNCTLRFGTGVGEPDGAYTPIQYLRGDSLLTYYGGQFYRAVGRPLLQIEHDAITRILTKRRVVPGMRVK